MAFEIGCFEIRSMVQSTNVEPKEMIELVEKVRTIQSFFPVCVLQQQKNRWLRRSVQQQLLKIKHYSEEDCILDMLNRYLMLLQFDREVIKCSFGAGYGIPVELVIGPRFQVSIKIENAKQPRLLAYFASIRHVLVSKCTSLRGPRYQVRLAMEPSSESNTRLELITFTFDTQEAADTVVHLLDGYCGESVGAVLQDAVGDVPYIHINQRSLREEFLPNGCPYRLREESGTENLGIEISRSCILLEQVIGDGQFGDVYKGTYKKNLHSQAVLVAVKTCKPESSVDDRKQFLEEARILGEFNHPHIIRLIGVCSSNPIWLVMEFAPLGELRHYMLANHTRVSLSLRVTFCYQIVTALTCLEERRCVHRDIAARNILVAREDWVKLADFGMARMLQDATEFKADKGKKMPIKWMPPESIHERSFSPASDVWMFGVCMWEILSGGVKPFADMTNAEAADLVTRGERLKRPAICPPHLYVLLLECWSTNPMRRPRFSSLKPRLRELAAQSANSEPLECLNQEFSDFNKIDDTGGRLKPARNGPVLLNDNQAFKMKHTGSRRARSRPFRSQWEELIELETKETGTIPRAQSAGHKSRHVGNGHMSRPTRNEQSNIAGYGQSRSPQRSPTRVTFIPSSVPNHFRDGQTIQSQPRSAPNISREPSPRRKTIPSLHLDEFMRLRDSSTETPKSRTTHTSTPVSTSGGSSSKYVNHGHNPSPEHSPSHFFNHYENQPPADPIYMATVTVVQTVRYVSQMLADASPDTYAVLVKAIGTAVKDLFLAVEAFYGNVYEKSEIYLAERQLNGSMYHLISTIRDANLSLNRGPLLEEFRRHLMTLAYVVANDAHSMYNAVHEHRMRNSDSSRNALS